MIGIGKKLKMKIGQRDMLSNLDIAQLRDMYKCNDKEDEKVTGKYNYTSIAVKPSEKPRLWVLLNINCLLAPVKTVKYLKICLYHNIATQVLNSITKERVLSCE